MKAYIIQVGATKGVRLPQSMLKAGNFGDVVEVEVCDEGILIRPVLIPAPVKQGMPASGYAPPPESVAVAIAEGGASFLEEGSWLE